MKPAIVRLKTEPLLIFFLIQNNFSQPISYSHSLLTDTWTLNEEKELRKRHIILPCSKMHPHNTGHRGAQLKLWGSFVGPAGSWPAEPLASGQKEPKEISGDGQSCPNSKWRRLHSPYLQVDWNNLISENGYIEKQPALAVCSSKLWQKHCILPQFLEAVLLGIKKGCSALPQPSLALPSLPLTVHTGILIYYKGIRKWSGFQPQPVLARWGFLTAGPFQAD